MAKIEVENVGTFEAPSDMRLVNALEEIAKVDQLHSCGGNAKCTTCRVEFLAGEPAKMTEAERNVLTARGLINTPGLRLSCQILCEQDMKVKIISRLAGSGKKDVGPKPEKEITPPAVWGAK